LVGAAEHSGAGAVAGGLLNFGDVAFALASSRCGSGLY
jgi:hypothetical protein